MSKPTTGDTVRICREWRDVADMPDDAYTVVEDNGDRLLIRLNDSGLPGSSCRHLFDHVGAHQRHGREPISRARPMVIPRSACDMLHADRRGAKRSCS